MTTKRTKRGFRRLTMTLRSSEYEVLARMAEEEARTPDQQAAYLLRRVLATHLTTNTEPATDVE